MLTQPWFLKDISKNSTIVPSIVIQVFFKYNNVYFLFLIFYLYPSLQQSIAIFPLSQKNLKKVFQGLRFNEMSRNACCFVILLQLKSTEQQQKNLKKPTKSTFMKSENYYNENFAFHKN